jgi:hypothetical protein
MVVRLFSKLQFINRTTYEEQLRKVVKRNMKTYTEIRFDVNNKRKE